MNPTGLRSSLRSSLLRLTILACGTLASAAFAQPPSSNLPEWAAPLGDDTRPLPSGVSSSTLDAGDIDPFPEDPQQVPMQGLVLLALAGAAYGARKLRASRD